MQVRKLLVQAAGSSKDRVELWKQVLNRLELQTAVEIGVYRGQFSEQILAHCSVIDRYYMIDPWRHLDDWNRPYNTGNAEFEEIMADAIARTEFAGDRRVILRGRSSEVLDRIPDNSLDFAYVDGDHTLRGITIDLMRLWPKMKAGGLIAGDDFHSPPRFWRAGGKYEPSLVFPWVVFFAEAKNAEIFGLPFSQFALPVDKSQAGAFRFLDLTGGYGPANLRDALLERHAQE